LDRNNGPNIVIQFVIHFSDPIFLVVSLRRCRKKNGSKNWIGNWIVNFKKSDRSNPQARQRAQQAVSLLANLPQASPG